MKHSSPVSLDYSFLIYKMDIIIISQISHHVMEYNGFLGGSVCKETICNEGDAGLIPGLGRSPGEGNGNLLQYSCLGNPMDRRAWATVNGVTRIGHDLVTEPPPPYIYTNIVSLKIIVQLLSCVQLFVTPWTAACQASLS